MNDDLRTADTKGAHLRTFRRGASGDEQLESDLLDAYETKYAIMVARHRKYGTGNIAASGRSGIITRIRDKLARIENGELNASDESYSDTLIDLANYADILMLWERGLWPVRADDVPLCRGCGRAL